jgi:hypothetical protein
MTSTSGEFPAIRRWMSDSEESSILTDEPLFDRYAYRIRMPFAARVGVSSAKALAARDAK